MPLQNLNSEWNNKPSAFIKTVQENFLQKQSPSAQAVLAILTQQIIPNGNNLSFFDLVINQHKDICDNPNAEPINIEIYETLKNIRAAISE